MSLITVFIVGYVLTLLLFAVGMATYSVRLGERSGELLAWWRSNPWSNILLNFACLIVGAVSVGIVAIAR